MGADLLLVTADEGSGLGLFAIEAGAPGLEVTRVVTVDGTRKQASVTMTGTPARRLGTGPASEEIAGVVDRLVVALVSDGLGAAEAALDLSVAYAKERVQFGRPIGAFQAVQHLCADMLHGVELGRGGVAFAQWAAGGGDSAERHRAACMAKAYAGDAFVAVGATTIQVLGGVGYTWEHDAHLFYKRLLTVQQSFGSTAEHLEEVASIVAARSGAG
ncbi:MAG: acyl-CoA dehydrogenase family protein [Acidimicrobiales bacterium]